MADIDTNATVVVDPTPAPRQLKSGALDIGLILTLLPALIAVLGKGNVDDIVAFFARQDVLAVLGALGSVAIVTLRQLWARRTAKKLVAAEATSPNVVFKGSPEAVSLKSQSK